ncbi:MAG: ATP-binding protein, partial [Psychrosphaera sp.]|nr:ATP-binding protein [Psychrosphaera sp.]
MSQIAYINQSNSTPDGQLNYLEQDMHWLEACIECRMAEFIEPPIDPKSSLVTLPVAPLLPEADVPDTGTKNGAYLGFVQRYQLNWAQRLIFLIALAPEVKPQMLDALLIKNSDTNRPFSEFGGYHLDSFAGFLPDVRSGLFILGGMMVGQQLELYNHFAEGSKLFSEDLLRGRQNKDKPHSHHRLQPSEQALEQVLSAQSLPWLKADFPAKIISTPLSWSHLVLADSTRTQLKELMSWLKLRDRFKGDPTMTQAFFQGYRCLFYGPSGTGKTLTASLLGKLVDWPVYRVDPALLVSKYIGETEKNLE